MAEKDKTVYIVNHSFISHKIEGIVIPREKFVAISSSLLEKLNANAIFKSLISTKEFELKNEIDDSMRTTEEQLRDAKAEIARLKEENGESEELKAAQQQLESTQQELADVKQEALDTINEKDEEIARLKEQLAKLAPGE